jgi:L,D-peptidoglycan transpeptidase YkuD (ErfK/YbiS/YcfS/YnhG family)
VRAALAGIVAATVIAAGAAAGVVATQGASPRRLVVSGRGAAGPATSAFTEPPTSTTPAPPAASVPTTRLPTAAATSTTVVTPTTTPPEPATTAPRSVAAASCPAYLPAVYGTDPNSLTDWGGGSQLVTVVAPASDSQAATLVAWARVGRGCWAPVVFAGQAAQPYRAETGYGGLIPLSRRVSGDGATPIGLFPFGATVYGNSPVNPTTHYPYHHLVCGDWWDELPGSPTYETFQHVACGTTPAYASDSEALWTEVEPYQHFIDIPMPHPPDNAAGIFLHDDTTAGDTAGCVALPPGQLDALLAWLRPADSPHILILAG